MLFFTHFNGTTHEEPIILKQLFAGHVVGPWRMKEKNALNDIVVGLVTCPLNCSEAGVDLVLIQTSLLLLCKSSCSYAN